MLGVDDVGVDLRDCAGQGPGHGYALSAFRADAAHVEAVEVGGARARGEYGDRVAGLAQGEAEGPDRPTRAPRPRRVDLGREQHLHRGVSPATARSSTASTCAQWTAQE